MIADLLAFLPLIGCISRQDDQQVRTEVELTKVPLQAAIAVLSCRGGGSTV